MVWIYTEFLIFCSYWNVHVRLGFSNSIIPIFIPCLEFSLSTDAYNLIFVGSILHYNDPNQDLKDLYFISPSWVCRLMSKVITVNAAHNFIPEGILHVNDIRHILGERNEEFPNRFYEKYMRLLNRFVCALFLLGHLGPLQQFFLLFSYIFTFSSPIYFLS